MQRIISQPSYLFEVYKSLFEFNPDAIYAIDKNGKFVMVNEIAEELTGYTRGELLELSFPDIVNAQYLNSMYEVFNEVLNRKKVSFEVSINHKSGTVVDLSITAVPIVFDHDVIGIAGMTKDVTEKNRIQRELMSSRNQLQNIFDNIDICLWSTNPSQTETFHISPACQKIYGYSQKEFLENPQLWKEAIHPEDMELVEASQKLMEAGEQLNFEYRIIDANGNIKWIADNTIPVFNEHGKLIRYEGVIIDVTKRRQVEEELRFMAFHDMLTELPNRRMFEKLLESAIQANKANKKIAVLYLDIDHFKLINDTLGHKTGDELLQIIAKRLRENLRKTDLLARQGGDEFAVLLTNVEEIFQIKRVIEKIIDAVSKPIHLDEREYELAVSVGVSIYPDHADHSEELLREADQAMYHAKLNGKNSFEIYKSGMFHTLSRRLELEQDLRLAIRNNDLTLNYQPIVDIQTSDIVGFEALARWNHSKLGFVPPAEFIPIAEESGLIVPLGEWVLRTACQQFKQLQMENYPETYVSVNVSTRQFQERNFVSQVERILKETDFDPRLLKIEITESIMMNNYEVTVAKLRRLEKIGIHLFLDDFGTGYSSLNYLQELPFNLMKIDKSFVQNINNGSGPESIIQTIIAMGNSLGLGIIAEGVEHESQLEYLKKLGCYNAQGYIYSRPVPFEQVRGLLIRGVAPLLA